jgi:hypothetical protein
VHLYRAVRKNLRCVPLNKGWGMAYVFEVEVGCCTRGRRTVAKTVAQGKVANSKHSDTISRSSSTAESAF